MGLLFLLNFHKPLIFNILNLKSFASTDFAIPPLLKIINNANDSDQLNIYTELINKIGNKDNYITRKCELLINNTTIDSNTITHNQCLILNNKINKFDITKLSLAKGI